MITASGLLGFFWGTISLLLFLETSESEVHFDVETAIKVLRQAGYYSHAVYLAEKHEHHEWYLKIQLEDIKVRRHNCTCVLTGENTNSLASSLVRI